MALKKTRRWSKDIETRYHPPAGLFSAGSAKTIATTLLRDAPSEAVAMDRLNFYINRAGSNLTVARRRVLNAHVLAGFRRYWQVVLTGKSPRSPFLFPCTLPGPSHQPCLP